MSSLSVVNWDCLKRWATHAQGKPGLIKQYKRQKGKGTQKGKLGHAEGKDRPATAAAAAAAAATTTTTLPSLRPSDLRI